MPKVGMDKVRKPQLIKATMQAVDEVGFHATSVALIGRTAQVSPGIINHYFGGKDGLIEATMRSVLQDLSIGVREQMAQTHPDDVVGRIQAIVRGNFDPRQLDSSVVKTWLAFWAHAMHHEKLFRLQRVNEKRLLSHLKRELKRALPTERADFVAHAIAALIDGIWLRGALNPEGINADLAVATIYDYLERHLPPELFELHQRLGANRRTANR
ncbi:transcriptional regulator BetI [Marinobacterium lutimaris]|uniref:HTH-type transcriptional regulator BetI n=1 Tax=Marinobacterium lutimaris TaxID=568106 RepID=A0A1H5TUC6_9GAMM|nr:transcriptional regulator BetI [Marinobacterium lutimaris]SEF66369.1 transcriptional regulator, TetR family [Marinobacterium lutimaris]